VRESRHSVRLSPSERRKDVADRGPDPSPPSRLLLDRVATQSRRPWVDDLPRVDPYWLNCWFHETGAVSGTAVAALETSAVGTQPATHHARDTRAEVKASLGPGVAAHVPFAKSPRLPPGLRRTRRRRRFRSSTPTPALPNATIPTSPIWRSGCQGVGVDGHGLVGVLVAVVAACGAVRASAGSRRSVMLIFGGWVPQDVCSSHVRCLESSAAAGWVGAQATNRGVVVREPGLLGPPRQRQRVVGGLA
jgi:hypothetical protein